MTAAGPLAGLRRLVLPAAAGIVVISLGASAAPVLWRLVEGDRASPQRRTLAASDIPGRPDLTAVLAARPFGAPAGEAAPAGAPVGETTLGLQLLGVAIYSDAAQSRAMIADASGDARSYVVGASVAAGIELIEVGSDHVLLRVNGATETLSFPDTRAAAVAAEPAPVATRADEPSGVEALRAMAPKGPATYGQPAPDTATDPDAVIARYRAAIRLNPASVMMRLGIEATAAGYVIKDITAPGVLRAGFRPGDIVTSVNGAAVGDVMQDVELFDRIAEQGLARVELQREGQQIVMSFPLR